jgi:hypothetical protein
LLFENKNIRNKIDNYNKKIKKLSENYTKNNTIIKNDFSFINNKNL